jgi:hypothetical protein
MAGAADNNATGAATSQMWQNNAQTAFDQAFYDSAYTAGSEGLGSYVSDAGTFVLAETALDMHCWGENPVVTAKLQLNGQDRFSEREGTYFDQVQPWQHHSRSPDTGINVYSFALRPEEHQPSGSCNFSRIDNATLQLVLSANTVSGTATAKVRVYALNYNVLRCMSGMGPGYNNVLSFVFSPHGPIFFDSQKEKMVPCENQRNESTRVVLAEPKSLQKSG